jgi:DUF1680 family protein
MEKTETKKPAIKKETLKKAANATVHEISNKSKKALDKEAARLIREIEAVKKDNANLRKVLASYDEKLKKEKVVNIA